MGVGICLYYRHFLRLCSVSAVVEICESAYVFFVKGRITTMNTLQRCTCGSIKIMSKLKTISKKFSGSLYEPDYLEGMKSKIPLYDTLNIQLKGYDYPILENYQKFLHNLIRNMDINVEECWAVPAQDLKVVTYKPQSEIVNATYSLKLYDRTVQITDISSLQLPILLRALEASTPVGVTVSVVPHEEYHENIRYIPDSELLTLKQQLDDLGGPRSKK